MAALDSVSSGTTSVIVLTQVTDDLGFTRWQWIPLLYKTRLDTLNSIAYNEIPKSLLPAPESQFAFETTTCSITAPWGGFDDPFTEFFRGGGASGTLIGALNGLNIISQSFLQKSTANYGLGREYTGPQLGYCVGTIFKEKIYTEVSAENVLNYQFLGSSSEDLIFRSKFERFYLNNGIIKKFTTVDASKNKYQITIDTKAETTSVNSINLSKSGDKIKLYRRDDGSSVFFSVDKVTGIDGGIQIDITSLAEKDVNSVFQSSDFFILSKSWLIQDPYLLDGVMNNISVSTLPTGSQEFFRTDQNSSLSEASITGVYIRKKNFAVGDEVNVSLSGKDGVISGIATFGYVDVNYIDGTKQEDIPVEDVKLLKGDLKVDMPIPDTDIESDTSFSWFFYPITSGTTTSEIYQNNDRYIIIQSSNKLTGRTEYTEKKIPIATDADYFNFLKDENVTYMKVEISQGGRSTRTNFHDNCLVGSLLIQKNSYYEILGQEGGHIIDVSSLSISKKVFLDPKTKADYILPNEFGWKTVEWYMGDTKTRFLQGEITSINKTNKFITVEVNKENTPTTYEQSYFNLGSRDSISFFERFINQYPHDLSSSPRKLYTKYKGWYTYESQGVNSYSVLDIAIDPKRVSGESYSAQIKFSESPDNFSIGDSVFTIFDKSPIKRKTTFNGSYIMDVSSINSGSNVKICLDGFWLSPRFDVDIPQGTRLGLCGGRYWGLGDQAPDNENAIVFMRTPEGVLGLSSMYHHTSNEDYVLFYDYETFNMSIRRGRLSFKELPMKNEISIGLPSATLPATVKIGENTSIELDSSQDRTKSLIITTPNGDEVLLFSIGSIEEYYGTTICAEGEMNLRGFEYSKIPQDPNLYTFNGEMVSPIYEYMSGKYSRTHSKIVPFSIPTNSGPIIVSNPNIGAKINSAKIDYVKNNQIINNATLFDIYEINDDEIMICMGRKFGGFTVQNPDDPVKEISNSGTNSWDETRGVFIIGSTDTLETWGNPLLNKPFSDGDNQFGLLILDNIRYSCSLYNELSDDLMIIFISNDLGRPYIGLFKVSVLTLNYKNLKCIPEDEESQEFLWRPPALETPTYNPNPVIDNYNFVKKDHNFKDLFVKIASESDGVGQLTISNVTDFGVISIELLSDDTLLVFFDTLDGVRMFFSIDSGENWNLSEITLVKDAQAAIYKKKLLFYITPSGIKEKFIPENLLNKAMEAVAGKPATFIESIQNEFDNRKVSSLNTGPVQLQKLSGHQDDEGKFHIFYYNSEGKLCSSEGTDEDWKVSENF